jgi:diketogulonate reductase-like aldo/keto reductase
MRHISLGGLDVSRIGLGTMAMSGYYLDPDSSEAESIRTIRRALDLGVTFLDTAEVYGPYTNEELVGRALKGRRDEVVLATKFGLVSHAGAGAGVLDSSAANIRTAVEGSLKRLGTDRIDPLLPAPCRPQHADRGHRRRPGRAGGRGQGPAHRPVRGRTRNDPPRPRRVPDRRAADRVLPVDP